jgi:hypothetical protein
MKKLTFKTSEDFDDYFKGESPEITNGIVAAIVEAMTYGKKSAHLFEIHFGDFDNIFDISISSKQWLPALENALSHYEKWGMSDEAIDCYLLIKDVKAW